jgi:beta-lactamase regulating signal transducer with metallopeptidase domain
MTMSAFLLFLVKLNLAMAAAIVLVSLLRRPLRHLFGASIAYAVWFLVPIAGIASLLPPRVVTPALAQLSPVYVPAASISAPAMDFAPRVAEQLTGQSAVTAVMAPPLTPAHAMPDTALLLFAAWALGTLLMALYLTRLQLSFSAAVRVREAGPAVLGFFHPRIVTPDNFQKRFSPREQAAILAHERVHLARQDARINALTALLRCLCWFNPLIHLGARWLRIDQELACDATVVAGAIPRGDYAKALLKSQMVTTALPVGCNWTGSQHPLIERIALLKRQPPSIARRLAGASLVLLAATSAGLGAWAAQPPVIAMPETAGPSSLARATLPAIVAAPSLTPPALTPPALTPEDIRQTVVQTVANANPAGSGKDIDQSSLRPAKAVSVKPAPASAQTPSLVIEAQNTAAPARGGAQAPAETSTESVTVLGSRRMYHDFSRQFAAPTKMTGKIARWERRICPAVAGQDPHYAAFIAQHLKYIALAAGAPVNTDADCAPNIHIVFTTTPQDLLDNVNKNNQHYLGYFSSVAQKNALATVTRPIQAWYATESTDVRGRRHLDTGRSVVGGTTVQSFNGMGTFDSLTGQVGDNLGTSAGSALTDMAPFFYSTGSHINDGIHTGFNHVLIVIDSTKLAGQNIVPLADYIAMLALVQVNAPDACQELPSIVNTMAPGCDRSAQSLTMFDLAYLQALYHMSADRSLMLQRSEIGDLMTDRLEKSKQ